MCVNGKCHYRNFHSNHPRNPLLFKDATRKPMTQAMPTLTRDRSSASGSIFSRWPLWVWVAIGVAIGILISVLLIMRGRGNTDFYRADGVAAVSDGPGFAPLPVPGDEAPQVMNTEPVVGSDGIFSGSTRPFVIESPTPTAPPPERAPAPAAPTIPAPTPAPPTTATASQPDSLPEAIPELSPAPEYPAEAYRNGESGIVRVRATVDTMGNVAKTQVEVRSRSRSLDRAAVDAVRRWKFKPATKNGQRVQSDVIVPVEFKL